MVDTIVLILKDYDFQILGPDKFRPSAKLINNNIRCIQNPSKKELNAGIYKPRLTIENKPNLRGNFETTLRIELSLPKFLFGNNLDELRYKDFIPLSNKLLTVLEDMGIKTTIKIIENALVSKIHYSKNIPLTDGSTPYHYINKIKEANVTLLLDVNQTSYRNEGNAYKWHCNSYEVMFYDKIKELESGKKQNKKNSDLLKKIAKIRKRKKFEILRIEVGLNKRTKIKQLFKKLNIKTDLTFKKLFKPSISKKILLHYIDEIENKRPAIIDYKGDDKKLLAELFFNNPKIKPRLLFQFFGFKKILENMTIRELRNIFSSHNKRNWYRLINELNKVKLPETKNPFESIKKQLLKFKTIKLR